MVRGIGNALADLSGEVFHRPLALGQHVDDLGSPSARHRLGHIGKGIEKRFFRFTTSHAHIVARMRGLVKNSKEYLTSLESWGNYSNNHLRNGE